MLGMSQNTFLLLDAVVTIIGLIVLITRFKLHPFIALIIASAFLGLTSGMPTDKIIKSFQDGFGGVLGFVGIILALGTMLGKMMADSGGADQIARTLIRAFGKERVQWAMMFAAFLVGIPLFFEIGFVLLIPLVFIVARRTGVSLIKIGIPLLAGLSAVHGLVPPHPGPLLAIGVFGADIGKTILYGLIVALPTAIIAGPIYGSFISKYIPGNPSQELVDQLASEPESSSLPSFGITLATVLLPVLLMLLKTFADVALPDGNFFRGWMDMIGHPITALLLALLLSLYTFGARQGIDSKRILKLLDASLAPTAAIILIIGAGGGFKQMLVASGVGDVIGHMAVNAQISPILLAWLVALILHAAVGSATVAMMGATAIVAPMLPLYPGVSPEIIAIAIGSGAIGCTIVTDSLFWLVKQYCGASLSETFKYYTTATFIASLLALAATFLLSFII